METKGFEAVLGSAFDSLKDCTQHKEYSKRLLELKNIFKVQHCALARINSQRFFITMSEAFDKAMIAFLNMVAALRNLEKELHSRNVTNRIIFNISRNNEVDPKLIEIINACNEDPAWDSYNRLELESLVQRIEEKLEQKSIGVRFRKKIDERMDERTEIQESLIALERHIVEDAYSFIKAFDNAIQGYFNSDRQFLEFPGYHVSLYDLPIKLGTVYTLFINKVIQSFDKKASLSFLLCPEPFEAEGVRVRRLLKDRYELYSEYTKDLDNTEMCLISVPSSTLFDPSTLCIMLTHEIAHYTSREFRRVDERNGFLIEACTTEIVCSAYIVLHELLPSILDYDARNEEKKAQVLEKISTGCGEKFESELIKELKEDYRKETYIDGLSYDDTAIPNRLGNDAGFYSLTKLSEIIESASKNLKYVQREELTELLIDSIRVSPQQMNVLKDAFLDRFFEEFDARIQTLFYLARETVADTLAIKLLSLTKERYYACIKNEIKKSTDSCNEELAQRLKVRKQMVYTVFGWEADGDEVKPYCSPTSINELILYLQHVKEGFVPEKENDAKTMADALIGDEMISELASYML